MATAKSCERCKRVHRYYGPYDPEEALDSCVRDRNLSAEIYYGQKEFEAEKQSLIKDLEGVIFRNFKDEKVKVAAYDAIQVTRKLS